MATLFLKDPIPIIFPYLISPHDRLHIDPSSLAINTNNIRSKLVNFIIVFVVFLGVDLDVALGVS